MTQEHYDRAIERLKRHEGLRLTPYDDATGKELKKGNVVMGAVTIGYGRNLSKGISLATAQTWLAEDFAAAGRDVLAAFPWAPSMEPARFYVLVEVCYNIGLTKLKGFKQTLAAMERGDYAAAADGMLNSLWARQVGTRAKTLAAIMRTGDYGDA